LQLVQGFAQPCGLPGVLINLRQTIKLQQN
jgi:hypothetical protein